MTEEKREILVLSSDDEMLLGLSVLVPNAKDYLGNLDSTKGMQRKAATLSSLIQDFYTTAWRQFFEGDEVVYMDLSVAAERLRKIFAALLSEKGWNAGLLLDDDKPTGWIKISVRKEEAV